MKANRTWPTAIAICAVLCAVAGSAHAATITIENTLAGATGLFGQNVQNPLSASINTINPGGTLVSASLADVPGGHLGASASSRIPGTASQAEAFFVIGFSVQGGEAGDQLVVGLHLDGSFSPGGGGSYLLTHDIVMSDNGGETIATDGLSCSRGGCDPATGGLDQQLVFSLFGVDSITFTGILTIGSGPALSAQQGASADFMNSALLSITAPAGTIIKNNPGGSLFQIAGTQPVTAVPEPTSLMLFGTGAVGLAMRLKRRRRV